MAGLAVVEAALSTQPPPLRVIIADDDADARYLMRRALDRVERFTVVGEAADGAAAVELARSAPSDVVLLDLNMPVLDGLQALPQVRAVSPPGAVIVVISARPSEEARAAVRAGELAAVLEKAPGMPRLVADLLAVIEGSGAMGDLGTSLHWSFEADLTSGALARKVLREALAEWELEHLLDEVELLATELVNNAVVHAESKVSLTAVRRADAIRIEVEDTGGGDLVRGEGALGDISGRGLLLVDAIASDWGTAHRGDAKTVWFELAV
jgi:DNA-binding NarL/FixJ family response regulator